MQNGLLTRRANLVHNAATRGGGCTDAQSCTARTGSAVEITRAVTHQGPRGITSIRTSHELVDDRLVAGCVQHEQHSLAVQAAIVCASIKVSGGVDKESIGRIGAIRTVCEAVEHSLIT